MRQTALRFTSHQNFSLLQFSLTSFVTLNVRQVFMVTASHNPAAYNGYKAYGEDGCQMTDVAANTVYDEISKLDMFKDVKIA